MIPSSTPTIFMRLPFDGRVIDDCEIIFAQRESKYSSDARVVLTKGMDNCDINKDIIKCKLTSEETLRFDYRQPVEIQFSCSSYGNVLVSKVIKVSVEELLKGGK